MLNVEGVLRAYLQSKLGIPVYVAVPENPPADFATVERTGGGDGRTPVSENPTVVVDYWGGTRARAWNLANRGDGALVAFESEPGISRVDFNSTCVHYPDYASGHERYESTYSITTYEY